MDDSAANIRAVDALKAKYPEVNLRTKLVTENYWKREKIRILETKIRDSFNKLLNNIS
jgi:hypothetical protein